MQLTITDSALPRVSAVIASLQNAAQLHANMAMGIEYTVLRHIRTKLVSTPNKLGAQSTGFWQKAANSVVARSTAQEAVVEITHRGVALQYYGGTVTPKNKKALTIPIHPDAHGKWVGDFPQGTIFRIPGTALLARKVGDASSAQIQPLFLLRRSVKVNSNPDVLPTEDEIRTAALDAGKAFVERALKQQ